MQRASAQETHSPSAQSEVAQDSPLENAQGDEAVPESPAALEPSAPEPTSPADSDAPSGPAMTFEPATQDPTSSLGGTELDRYARLREWRDAEAQRLEISRFQVASNALLSGVARANPDSLAAFEHVKGIGPERVKRYGQAILSVLHGAPVDSSEAATETSSVPELDATSQPEPDLSSEPAIGLEPITEIPSRTQTENAVLDGAAVSVSAPKRRGRPRKVIPTEPSA